MRGNFSDSLTSLTITGGDLTGDIRLLGKSDAISSANSMASAAAPTARP